MANAGRDPSHLSYPPMHAADERMSDTADSFFKSERPSSIPVPSGRSNIAATAAAVPTRRPKSSAFGVAQHRFLSPAEWARVAHGLGAIREGETHSVVHPTCWYWPPKGLPDGLYKDVIFQRSKYYIKFEILSTIRWFLMILQIIFGAILTALGSVNANVHPGIPITVLAAVNTVGAGLLALMHNSGLPDRYRLNKVEFTKVEDFLKEILDTGIVESGQTVDDILSECFTRFQIAKATVLINMPDHYTTSSTTPREKSMVLCPDPPVHFSSGHP
ncbi:hypothetical protein B0H66DRAFT_267144 [Apodospora peruviana]|uniref:SMODS and SLOG-associating 2TM effector domain-containing protein n=1 Tax=Apodospora peruviana TaxID=516989 RepID=A0AAE0I7Z4_9PEZI|nr:hypothetical protein B0H66DRAFT_267144 [Apodospora peruviana]